MHEAKSTVISKNVITDVLAKIYNAIFDFLFFTKFADLWATGFHQIIVLLVIILTYFNSMFQMYSSYSYWYFQGI